MIAYYQSAVLVPLGTVNLAPTVAQGADRDFVRWTIHDWNYCQGPVIYIHYSLYLMVNKKSPY